MILYQHPSVAITDATFEANRAARGGALINLDSEMWLARVSFSGNSARSYGGALVVDLEAR